MKTTTTTRPALEPLPPIAKARKTLRLIDLGDKLACLHTGGIYAPAVRIGYPIGYPVYVESVGDATLVGGTEDFALVECEEGDDAGKVRSIEWSTVGPRRCNYDTGEEAGHSRGLEELQWLARSLYALDLAAYESKDTAEARKPIEARIRVLTAALWPKREAQDER